MYTTSKVIQEIRTGKVKNVKYSYKYVFTFIGARFLKYHSAHYFLDIHKTI